MRHIDLPRPLVQAVAWAQRLWWRIRRPATYGVKAFLTLPDGRFLVVRHAYGDPARWGLPGGGYRPGRETPRHAVAREVAEELHIDVAPNAFAVVDRAVSTLEGKRDTVTILTAAAVDEAFTLAPEIAEARWIRGLDDLGAAPVSRWLRSALALTRQ
jgi:8-oxo-dGTP diphosphatase